MRLKFREPRGGPPPCDPTQFADPVAMRTSWLPLRKGRDMGRRFKEVSSFRAAFTLPRGQIVATYVGFGLVIALLLVLGLFQIAIGKDVDVVLGAVALCSVPFLGFLVWYYLAYPPIIFDKRLGRYWTGRGTHPPGGGRRKSRKSGDTEDIHAIQILARLYRSDAAPQLLYEPNLVFSDGQRVSLCASAWPSRVRADGNELSAFLDRPVWDGATHVEVPEMDGGRIAELLLDHPDDASPGG